jgi:hypothetical protein
VWIPISVPEGRERDDVVASVLEQVVRIADALRGIAPPEAPVETPPVAEGR